MLEPVFAVGFDHGRQGRASHSEQRAEPVQTLERPFLDPYVVAERFDRHPRLGVVRGPASAENPFDPKAEVCNTLPLGLHADRPVSAANVVALGPEPLRVVLSAPLLDALPGRPLYGRDVSVLAASLPLRRARADVSDHGIPVRHPLHALVRRLRDSHRVVPAHPAVRCALECFRAPARHQLRVLVRVPFERLCGDTHRRPGPRHVLALAELDAARAEGPAAWAVG
mmetsp:Transcript_58503/g.163142  ORF Transcript_58503/g.163142 Transcript_58503/m.163142 type:complete len:226 (-) Transcript_58503:747-1424(-)